MSIPLGRYGWGPPWHVPNAIHKYDPISQEDYFRFFDLMNQTQDADRRDENPRVELFTESQLDQKTLLQKRQSHLRSSLETMTQELQEAFEAWESSLGPPVVWERLSSWETRLADHSSSQEPTALENGAWRLPGSSTPYSATWQSKTKSVSFKPMTALRWSLQHEGASKALPKNGLSQPPASTGLPARTGLAWSVSADQPAWKAAHALLG